MGALDQIVERQARRLVLETAGVGRHARDVDQKARNREARVRPEIGRHLVGSRFVDAQLAGTQRRIVGFEPRAHLGPRERCLSCHVGSQTPHEHTRNNQTPKPHDV